MAFDPAHAGHTAVLNELSKKSLFPFVGEKVKKDTLFCEIFILGLDFRFSTMR
jgi:hypothetical protein